MNQAPRGSISKKARDDRDARIKRLEALTDDIQAIRKRFASRIAAAGRDIEKALATAILLEEEMLQECTALAGEGLEEVHTISFQIHGGRSMDEQMENLGEILGPNVEDMMEATRFMAETAEDMI